MELKEAEVQLTYRNKKTGELFKERVDWEAKVIRMRTWHKM